MTTLLWQLFDSQGRPIRDGGAAKLKAIMEGTLHGSAHLWIWRETNGNVEVLLQKRADSKINWPGRLDKSAGGHITYGEEPINTALRKCKAELGLRLMPEQLQFVGIRYWKAPVDGADMVENEFQWVYVIELAEPEVHIPTTEVAEVEWRSLARLTNETGGGSSKRYVPYGHTYYQMLEEAITRAACLSGR